ncbi:MAG TPA: hypothetical protein PLR32_00255 [candidate division Zixibacteria bacterium]|nr:hypothetical protein [candidate division Zixibacteria bacterium]MDD4916720.1 hypothetical protein [candidate division Zixibacteria bacterium]MDM7972578.1 hypothetical protein [candidate division Zixibacteria bacterium]HOD66941.1 hypothetical protein [candidate division Zixibacteria bacterium]HOZ07713.1 hypothetical protein [candidate division Zixibacteria bacterium]
MKKNIGLLVILLVAVVGVMMGTACRDDYYLPAPPSIEGCYTGTYTYVSQSGSEVVVSKEQVITASFTETKFFLDADTLAEGYNKIACFCVGRFFYSISDRVQIEPIDDRPLIGPGCDSCDPDESPTGTFQLYRPGNDVKLECIETVTSDGGSQLKVTKTLMLTRVACPSTGA